jgi:hypothetical protein
MMQPELTGTACAVRAPLARARQRLEQPVEPGWQHRRLGGRHRRPEPGRRLQMRATSSAPADAVVQPDRCLVPTTRAHAAGQGCFVRRSRGVTTPAAHEDDM